MLEYGDSFHHNFRRAEDDGSAIVQWCKSGYCRAVLQTPTALVPIMDYDSAADATNDPTSRVRTKACGWGSSYVTPETAKALLEHELREFQARLEPGAWNGPEAKARDIRAMADRCTKATRPYHWYSFGPLDWALAAEAGCAVEYRADGSWDWCTPERAREVAQHPISVADYMRGLREQIAALAGA